MEGDGLPQLLAFQRVEGACCLPSTCPLHLPSPLALSTCTHSTPFHFLCAGLRALGRNIAANVPGTLPNCESVLRNTTELQRGVIIEKVWPGFGVCKAKIISIDSGGSRLSTRDRMSPSTPSSTRATTLGRTSRRARFANSLSSPTSSRSLPFLVACRSHPHPPLSRRTRPLVDAPAPFSRCLVAVVCSTLSSTSRTASQAIATLTTIAPTSTI